MSPANEDASIDTRIVFIDGSELVRLMIAPGVEVAPVAVCELKRGDSDFLAEKNAICASEPAGACVPGGSPGASASH